MLTPALLTAALVERVCFLLWAEYQDRNMVPKFTDIDYKVFTDAARYVANGESPYLRDTYRYTPLLAWLLTPTAYKGLFVFGKLVFVFGDLMAGYLIILTLLKMHKDRKTRYTEREACELASLWLLNPMVAAISTRGSSEGLLGTFVMLFIYLGVSEKYFLSGLAGGFAIHFKIYPFIYAPTMLWWMGPPSLKLTKNRIVFILGLVIAFIASCGVMYQMYGSEYLQHSWIYHMVRIDHRHNFSPYATILYYTSALNPPLKFEHYAFIPQLLLTAVLLPLAFARKNPVGTMAVQTFAFVAFNKVCTSQYFIWYILLLPFLVPNILKAGRVKWTVLAAWIGFQAIWLRDAYFLEFLGTSTFYPQLFRDSLMFFFANIAAICFLIQCL